MRDWLEIHALVDDELSAEERARLQAALTSDPRAQLEFQTVKSLKVLVASRCTHHDCDEQWRMCVKRLNEIDKTKKVEWFVAKYGWGICSAFVVVILGPAMFNRANGGRLHSDELSKISSTLITVPSPRSQTPQDKQQYLQSLLDKPKPVNSHK